MQGGYAPPQDPNMYYGGYPGYANYQQPQQVLYKMILLYCKATARCAHFLYLMLVGLLYFPIIVLMQYDVLC